MSEKAMLKAVVLYILRARVGAINYYDKAWKKGTVIITDANLYFYDGKYSKIPLAKITDMKREVISGSAWRDPGHPVMSVRYYEGDKQVTTLVSSTAVALEKIRKTIESQGGSRTEVDVNDSELRILILLYTGITDWNTISAVLSFDKSQILEVFNSLRKKGLLDSFNNLTALGSRIVRKSGKI